MDSPDSDFTFAINAPIDPADWPAAKAALDALVEAEEGEWVLLPAPNREEPYIRISKDGQRVQERTQEGRWNDYDAWWIKAAYRKGREVAQQESSALRDAARELVEAVRPWGQGNIYTRLVTTGQVEQVVLIAKALEGKL